MNTSRLGDMTDKQLMRLWRLACSKFLQVSGIPVNHWDWRTLRLSRPGWYDTFNVIHDEFFRREMI